MNRRQQLITVLSSLQDEWTVLSIISNGILGVSVDSWDRYIVSIRHANGPDYERKKQIIDLPETQKILEFWRKLILEEELFCKLGGEPKYNVNKMLHECMCDYAERHKNVYIDFSIAKGRDRHVRKLLRRRKMFVHRVSK